MGNLEFGPEAHWALHLFAGFLLVAHIAGGCVGILSGAAAAFFRKGSPWHLLAGKVFVVSMLIMSGVAAGVAPFLDQRVNVVAALVTFYLVVTARVAAKRRVRAVNAWDRAGLIFIATVTAYTVYLQQLAANSDRINKKRRQKNVSFYLRRSHKRVNLYIGDASLKAASHDTRLSLICRRKGIANPPESSQSESFPCAKFNLEQRRPSTLLRQQRQYFSSCCKGVFRPGWCGISRKLIHFCSTMARLDCRKQSYRAAIWAFGSRVPARVAITLIPITHPNVS
jgi:hypothetical protein